jgi:outer membrane protein assembly factor BamE (lipoprotein component of BamABCDE complex)
MMIVFKYLAFTSLAVMFGVTLASCTPVVAKRGNTIDDDQLSQVVVGVSRREDVASVLGTPTQMGTFDDKVWYYIGQRTEQEAFFDPELKEQKIVTVEFTPEGVVSNVSKSGAEKARDITPVADRTPTYGKEITVMQQLLGNLGKPTIPKTGKGQ